MKYLFQICDAKDNPDRDGRRPAVGEFIMEATSEMDALTNFHKTPEYHKVMDTIPDDVKNDVIFHVENNYVKNLDVKAVVKGTTDFDLQPGDIHHIRACGLTLTSNDSDMIYHKGKNYLNKKDFTVAQTGPRSFEASMSLYGKPNTDAVMKIPKYEYVETVPIHMDMLNGTFDPDKITEIAITIIDRNTEKVEEMKAFGEPAYMDKDGNPVYEVTFDESLIKDRRFAAQSGLQDEINEDEIMEESFSEAVAGISTEESGKLL